MIKKYVEYINELHGDYYAFSIPKEEIEDHFLRLEEVYCCYCSITLVNYNRIYINIYTALYYANHPNFNFDNGERSLDYTRGWNELDYIKYRKDIDNEIDTIIKRLKNIYPKLLVEKEEGRWKDAYSIKLNTKDVKDLEKDLNI